MLFWPVHSIHFTIVYSKNFNDLAGPFFLYNFFKGGGEVTGQNSVFSVRLSHTAQLLTNPNGEENKKAAPRTRELCPSLDLTGIHSTATTGLPLKENKIYIFICMCMCRERFKLKEKQTTGSFSFCESPTAKKAARYLDTQQPRR